MNKAPVTAAAVLKRINRALAKDLKQLIKNRRGPYAERLPEWLEIDLDRNHIVGGTDDLEEFARELGVLREWECLPRAREEVRDPAPAPAAKPTSVKGRPKAPIATGRSRRKQF